MHCPNCGHKLPDDAAFCTNCGKQILTQANAQTTGNEASSGNDATSGKKVPDKQRIYQIVGLVAGIALLVLGILRIMDAFHVFDKKPETEPTVQTTQQDTKPQDEPTTKERTLDKSKLVDKNGIITAYACAELDGKGLHEIISENDYDLITNGNATYYSFNTQYVAFLANIDKDEHCASYDELDGLGIGAKGTPAWFNIICAEYDTVDAANKALGAVEFDEFEAGKGDMSCGVFRNIEGDEFLYVCYINDGGNISVQVFNEEAITSGLLSEFGTTIKTAYKGLVDLANSTSSTSSRMQNEQSTIDLG